VCGIPAAHTVSENLGSQLRPIASYLCCAHFAFVLGDCSRYPLRPADTTHRLKLSPNGNTPRAPTRRSQADRLRAIHDALLAAGRHLFAECSGAVSAEQLGDDQVSGVRPPAGSVSRGGPHPLAVINESERARQPAG